MQTKFSTIGGRHLHLDGARNKFLIFLLVGVLRLFRFPTRFHYVKDFVAGRQREILPVEYQSHTPGVAEEELSFFTSTLLPDRTKTVKLVRLIYRLLSFLPGTVLEVEQIIAELDAGTKIWRTLHGKADDALTAYELGFPPGVTWQYEVHHGVNLSPGSKVDLVDLMAYCSDRGMNLGGWFVFLRSNEVALRSNSFTNSHDFVNQVERESDVIVEYFRSRGLEPTRQRCLVERVLLAVHA